MSGLPVIRPQRIKAPVKPLENPSLSDFGDLSGTEILESIEIAPKQILCRTGL
jgi:hypothetical protein